MFLNFLTEDAEQLFFLKFAYLLAVAEKDTDAENTPTRACSDNPEKGEYAFEEFAPDFPMQTGELLMLRKFAEEMGMTWAPVSSYNPASSLLSTSLTMGASLADAACGALTALLPSVSLDGGWQSILQGAAKDTLEKIARERTVAGMLKAATEKLNNTRIARLS